jgi:hypothetical protein
MNDKELEILLTGVSENIQDNSVMILALIEVLLEKEVITLEEYNAERVKQEKKLEELIKKTLKEVLKHQRKQEKGGDLGDFSWFGKGGEA